jgi:hypothetical protein
MRKKCAKCGLICFAFVEICGRCGSTELFEPQISNDLKPESKQTKPIKIHWWGYLICFVLGVVIEFFALFPVLANIGWRHSAAAPISDSERSSQFWAFLLHLPTVLLPWMLNQIIDIFGIFYLFIPLTQIVFWTYFLAFISKRLKILVIP